MKTTPMLGSLLPTGRNLRGRAAWLLVLGLLLAVIGACSSKPGEPSGSSTKTWDVSALVDAEVTGAVQVRGSLYDGGDGDGLVLCGVLAESFPPQCLGQTIPITNPELVEADFTTAAEVRWTDRVVVLDGEMVDGKLSVTP